MVSELGSQEERGLNDSKRQKQQIAAPAQAQGQSRKMSDDESRKPRDTVVQARLHVLGRMDSG